ncbi:MAG: hypothetical protein U0892_13875 [Pirellulales bacterium]
MATSIVSLYLLSCGGLCRAADKALSQNIWLRLSETQSHQRFGETLLVGSTFETKPGVPRPAADTMSHLEVLATENVKDRFEATRIAACATRSEWSVEEEGGRNPPWLIGGILIALGSARSLYSTATLLFYLAHPMSPFDSTTAETILAQQQKHRSSSTTWIRRLCATTFAIALMVGWLSPLSSATAGCRHAVGAESDLWSVAAIGKSEGQASGLRFNAVYEGGIVKVRLQSERPPCDAPGCKARKDLPAGNAAMPVSSHHHESLIAATQTDSYLRNHRVCWMTSTTTLLPLAVYGDVPEHPPKHS